MYFKKSFLLIVILLAGYLAALNFLTGQYSETRWIPKTTLALPSFIEKALIQNTDNGSVHVPSAPLYAPQENVLGFQVLYDSTPLPALELVRPWVEETAAAVAYAKPSEDTDTPKIALVLTDVGLDEALFAESIQKLPPVVTLSFSPYALDLASKVKYVRQKGFENMLDIAVLDSENGFDNAGKWAFDSNQSELQTERLISRHYLDLNVPMTGFWVSLPDGCALLPPIINQKGLLCLDSLMAEGVQKNHLYPDAVRAVLVEAEQQAIQNGHFILVLPIHPAVVTAIVNWVGLEEHTEVSFVPLSVLKQELKNES